jgi:hypothetical protein
MQIATMVVRTPDRSTDILRFIANNGPPLVDPTEIVHATTVLLDVLAEDQGKDFELQTLLFDIALTHAPRLAEELVVRNFLRTAIAVRSHSCLSAPGTSSARWNTTWIFHQSSAAS